MAVKYLKSSVGKRKTSIARLYLRAGSGEITINNKPIDQYYLRPTSKMLIKQPLELIGAAESYDLTINVRGGGLQGQAGAIRHAIAKALADLDVSNRAVLKRAGMLTRDARKKERKLPGQPSARKKFQFSKR